MSSILLQYPKNPKVEANWRAKRGTRSDVLTSFVAKHQKIGGGTLWEFFLQKSLTMPNKTERGDLWDFPFLSPSIKKIEAGPLRKKNFQKKSLNAEKKLKRGTLQSRQISSQFQAKWGTFYQVFG